MAVDSRLLVYTVYSLLYCICAVMSTKESYAFAFMCLSVCLSVRRITKKLSTYFDEIFRRGGMYMCDQQQLIKLWR